MLRATVNVNRKISENYNSTGFGLSLDGEIPGSLDDPEGVIEKIKELFDLAEETLNQQVDRHHSDLAIASRDAEPQTGNNGRSNGRPAPTSDHPAPVRNGHRDEKPPVGEPATNKQVQFLLTLTKRQRLQGPKLEAFIEETVGRGCSPYDLTKKEAGAVINALNPEEAGDNRRR